MKENNKILTKIFEENKRIDELEKLISTQEAMLVSGNIENKENDNQLQELKNELSKLTRTGEDEIEKIANDYENKLNEALENNGKMVELNKKMDELVETITTHESMIASGLAKDEKFGEQTEKIKEQYEKLKQELAGMEKVDENIISFYKEQLAVVYADKLKKVDDHNQEYDNLQELVNTQKSIMQAEDHVSKEFILKTRELDEKLKNMHRISPEEVQKWEQVLKDVEQRNKEKQNLKEVIDSRKSKIVAGHESVDTKYIQTTREMENKLKAMNQIPEIKQQENEIKDDVQTEIKDNLQQENEEKSDLQQNKIENDEKSDEAISSTDGHKEIVDFLFSPRAKIEGIEIKRKNEKIIYIAHVLDAGLTFDLKMDASTILQKNSKYRKEYYDMIKKESKKGFFSIHYLKKSIDPTVCALLKECTKKYNFEETPEKLIHDYAMGFADDDKLKKNIKNNIPVNYDISMQDIEDIDFMDEKFNEILYKNLKNTKTAAKKGNNQNITFTKFKTRFENFLSKLMSTRYDKNKALGAGKEQNEETIVDPVTYEKAQNEKNKKIKALEEKLKAGGTLEEQAKKSEEFQKQAEHEQSEADSKIKEEETK